MLNRRKVLIWLVQRHKEPISLIRLQKLMFLFVKESKNDYYHFIPNSYGCYSISLHDDQIALQQKHIIIEEKGKTPFSSYVTIDEKQADLCNIKLKKDDEVALEMTLRENEHLSDNELITKVYKGFPFYSIRSALLDNFRTDPVFLEKLDQIRNKIESSPRALLTIGYEGLSIDRFIQLLILQNVKYLVDVRKNPFSMRPEYRKARLQTALQEADISYLHIPEVGISSTLRKEFPPSEQKAQLFELYSKHTLPHCEEHAEAIAGLIAKVNVALMCYEKNPRDCHRMLFAEYCKKKQPSIPRIIHIRGDAFEEETIHHSPDIPNPLP